MAFPNKQQQAYIERRVKQAPKIGVNTVMRELGITNWTGVKKFMDAFKARMGNSTESRMVDIESHLELPNVESGEPFQLPTQMAVGTTTIDLQNLDAQFEVFENDNHAQLQELTQQGETILQARKALRYIIEASRLMDSKHQ